MEFTKINNNIYKVTDVFKTIAFVSESGTIKYFDSPVLTIEQNKEIIKFAEELKK